MKRLYIVIIGVVCALGMSAQTSVVAQIDSIQIFSSSSKLILFYK